MEIEVYDVGTFQPIDGPLLEFFQCDFRGGGDFVEIQSVLVFLLLVCWCRELLLLVVDGTPPFRVDATEVLSYHRDCCVSKLIVARRSYDRLNGTRASKRETCIPALPRPLKVHQDRDHVLTSDEDHAKILISIPKSVLR